MPNAWIDALKKWNEGKSMWCLPKKGTKDYDEVRALMPPKAEKPKKEPKAPKAPKGEAPLPKIAEGTTREQLMDMLESYTEERRRLAGVKGKKLTKGMERIDKLEGQVKEKIKEMEAAAPKAKRVIKVSKKVHEAAAPKNETVEKAPEKMSGEEKMKKISELLSQKKAEKGEKGEAPKPKRPSAEDIALYRIHSRRGGDKAIVKEVQERNPDWHFPSNVFKYLKKQATAEKRSRAIIARRANKKRDS